MNIQALEQYVESKNRWGSLFGTQPLSLLNAEDRQKIADSIDSELSPENLTCDGELSRAEIVRRHKVLTAAATELARIDPVAANAIYELYTGE